MGITSLLCPLKALFCPLKAVQLSSHGLLFDFPFHFLNSNLVYLQPILHQNMSKMLFWNLLPRIKKSFEAGMVFNVKDAFGRV